MKTFVREYGKPAAIVAAAAFALSFLVGLLSRNPFGTALLRALALAVVFGGIGVAILFVVKKYLPELAGGAARAGTGTAADEHSVDITLQEEHPGKPSDAEADEPQELTAADSVEEAEEVRPAAEAAEASLQEPFGARKPETDQEYELSERDAVDAVSGQAVGEPEPAVLEPVEQTEPGKPGGGAALGVEALPDFGDLGSIGGPPRAAGAPRMERRRPIRPSDAAQGDLGQESPESLAKAIRTVIKRDERG